MRRRRYKEKQGRKAFDGGFSEALENLRTSIRREFSYEKQQVTGQCCFADA